MSNVHVITSVKEKKKALMVFKIVKILSGKIKDSWPLERKQLKGYLNNGSMKYQITADSKNMFVFKGGTFKFNGHFNA